VEEILYPGEGSGVRTYYTRLAALREVRRRDFSLCVNLHGGPTSRLFTRWSAAPWRVGFAHFRGASLYNILVPDARTILHKPSLHTAEHQAAAFFHLGLPQTEIPRAQIFSGAEHAAWWEAQRTRMGIASGQPYAIIHPTAAYKTKEWAPVPQFLDVPGLVKDIQKITDAGRGKKFSNFMLAMGILKNYKPFKAPKSLALMDLIKKFDKSFALSGEKKTREKYGASDPNRTLEDALKRRSDPWNLLFIAGMWFQDLFNYDFRRTEMCIIPYATQLGEISFCAYNTGIGWRKIIENMYKNASVAEWYKTHGKHAIYAKGKSVELDTDQHSLTVNAEDAARVRTLEHDVPLTAAEEDKARRKAAWEAEQAAQVRKVYEEIVLQKPKSDLVQIGAPAKAEEEKVAV